MTAACERAIEASDNMTVSLVDRRVAAVRAMLQAEGDGECVGCGAEIGDARRAALPSATRCVGCQSRLESKVK